MIKSLSHDNIQQIIQAAVAAALIIYNVQAESSDSSEFLKSLRQNSNNSNDSNEDDNHEF